MIVHNWREALRWHSTQVFMLMAAIPIIWMELPDEVKALIPEEWRGWILTGVAVAGAIGRLRDQGSDHK